MNSRTVLKKNFERKTRFFKKHLDIFALLVYTLIRQLNIAELCKGSTTDSDSVCLGSNPSSAARKKHRLTSVLFSTKSVLRRNKSTIVDEIC